MSTIDRAMWEQSQEVRLARGQIVRVAFEPREEAKLHVNVTTSGRMGRLWISRPSNSWTLWRTQQQGIRNGQTTELVTACQSS